MALEDLLPAWSWPVTAPTGAREHGQVVEADAFAWESGEGGRWRLAVKENIAVRRRPGDREAPIVSRLRTAGATVVGTTRMHELAFGVTGRSVVGTVPNPAAPGRLPGGSSSGSAAAVASGRADVALATDTGGSARIPAALCGVVGFKASRALAVEGVQPLAPSLDHLGWITPTVAEAIRTAEALGFDCYTGPFTLGATSPAVTDEVAAAFAEALPRLTVERISWPHHDVVCAVTTTIMYAEAARLHRPGGRSPDVARRLEYGATVAPAQEAAARELGARLVAEWRSLPVDAVVQPTCGTTAPRYDESADVGVTARLIRTTRLDDLAGTPAVTVPIPGRPLPVGLHLSGREDGRLLGIARAVEAALRVAGAKSG